MLIPYTIAPLGDAALIIDFGNRIEAMVNDNVLALFQQLKQAFPQFLDVVPAYSSLTVFYDPIAFSAGKQTAFEAVKQLIIPFLEKRLSANLFQARLLQVPVCYAPSFAPDLKELAAQKELSVEEAIQLHTGKSYRVYMIGFLPGFAYMGKVNERIATPRRSQPRTQVPEGSVGIAGEQTGIYPFTSPGGWNIIGRTPLKLFDAERNEPVFFQPGDEVSFYSITEDEFANYQGRIA
jgi:inhibitor of KinA